MSKETSKQSPTSRSKNQKVVILCEICNISFTARKNLYAHNRRFHPGRLELSPATRNSSCPLCVNSCRSMSQLHEHLQNKHDVALHFTNETFYVKYDFLKWKAIIERESQSRFILRNTNNINDGIKLSYYACNRSGSYTPKQNRNHQLKVGGSIKSGNTCPATIKVTSQTVDDVSEIKVKYQSVHVGHSMDVGKSLLSKEERISLAHSFKANVPMSRILDQTREKFSPTKRHILTTCQDLRSIKKDYKTKSDIILHPNDAMSVDITVKKMQNETSNPVLLYKPEGEILPEYPCLKEDFYLGMMNDAQAQLLESYGRSCIMIDSTNGTNQYNYQLTTIMVYDNNHVGMPVATLFSWSVTRESLTPFFNEIRKRLPNFETKALLSDDTNCFYNAWQDVFGKCKHVLCSWHVKKNWEENINKKVKNELNKNLIKAELKEILNETDRSTFEKKMKDFIRNFKDSEEDFIQYFQEYYENRVEKWAHCYHVGLSINTIIKVERWHCQIKGKETGGTEMKRLDTSISDVRNAVDKKLLSRAITAERRKLIFKVSKIQNRHKTSLEMKDDYEIIKMNHKYVVKKNVNGSLFTHEVEIADEKCRCRLKCDLCNICLHNMTCTCVDRSIHDVICKHIHYVCQNYPFRSPDLQESVESQSIDDSLVVDYDDHQDIEMYEEVVLSSALKKTPTENSSNQKKRVLSSIQDIYKRLEGVDSAEILKQVENSLKSINALLDSSEASTSGDSNLAPIEPEIPKAPPTKKTVEYLKKESKRVKLSDAPRLSTFRILGTQDIQILGYFSLKSGSPATIKKM